MCVFSSAYEPKRAAGPNKSSCPQGTPMSPMQHHYSPKPAGSAGGRPDNTAYNMNSPAASQPLPNHNNYPMNPRYYPLYCTKYLNLCQKSACLWWVT